MQEEDVNNCHDMMRTIARCARTQVCVCMTTMSHMQWQWQSQLVPWSWTTVSMTRALIWHATQYGMPRSPHGEREHRLAFTMCRKQAKSSVLATLNSRADNFMDHMVSTNTWLDETTWFVKSICSCESIGLYKQAAAFAFWSKQPPTPFRQLEFVSEGSERSGPLPKITDVDPNQPFPKTLKEAMASEHAHFGLERL